MAWNEAELERVLGEIIHRSQRDPAFRRLCIEHPDSAVKAVTADPLPRGFKLNFVDNNNADVTVVLPDPLPTGELTDESLANVSGGSGGFETVIKSEITVKTQIVVKPGIKGFCFAAGTPVLMADGSTRAIDQLVIGDAVL